MRIDCAKLPVMKGYCKTCPFKPDENGIMRVTSRTLFKAHQICHSTEGENREPRNRCKGSFDFNYTIYERLGFADLIQK
jgi:hypothetical protein